MKRFYRFVLIVAAFVATASPAHAGPVLTAIGSVITAIKGSVVLAALARVAASAVLSRLAASLGPKPRPAGIRTDGTVSGSQNPASFIFGKYATDGVHSCPEMSHGKVGKTPNAYLTYVIELSDVPGASLLAVLLNGHRCQLGATPHADYGSPVVSSVFAGLAWVKYYNGTQTVADPMLLAKYSTYPERPWTTAMVGRGICYAILTFRRDAKVFPSFPKVRFEMQGHGLYDPRKDSTVGGSGAHRLANSATWEITNNPIIMIYNAHLGIVLPGGHVWGGRMPVDDMPLASVFAAANACDALVDNGLSGTEPRFRAGLEVFVTDEPASICEDFQDACLGQVADVSGRWRFQAGDPALPTFFFTDDDLLVSLDREKQPFPGLDGTSNGITASYPDPAMQWESNVAPPIYNATWEARDGNRRLAVNKTFSAVPYPAQVQRNMRALLADDQRFLTHGLPFPPEATVLEPLDTSGWTSTSNGYGAKTFEIGKTTENLRTGVVQATIRERDPSDTAVVPGYYTAFSIPSATPVVPAAQILPGWSASGYIVADATATSRAPGGIGIWDGTELDDATGVQYQVRVAATGQVIIEGVVSNVTDGRAPVSAGMLRKTGYEMRALLLVTGRATSWTAWTYFLSPDIAPVQAGDVGLGAVAYGNLIGPQTGVGLNADRFCRDATAWKAVFGAFSIVPDTAASGGSSLQSATIAGQFLSERFAIDRLRNHIAQITIRRTAGTATTYLMVAFQDASGANITTAVTGGLIGWPSASTYFYFGLTEQVPPASNTTYSIAFGPDEVAKIPPTAAFAQIGFLSNFTGGAGTQAISNADIYEKIGNAQLGDGAVRPVHLTPGLAGIERFAALPATGNFVGRTVYLTTNNKIYRHTGAPADANGFTAAADGADIVAASVTANKLAVVTLSAISADVGTLIAGLIQSPNFVAGSTGARLNLATGDAEFNTLVVRSDMILLGAVSNTFGIRKSISPIAVASPTVSTILGNTLNFPAGTYKQLVNASNFAVIVSTFAANPIVMTGLVTVTGTNGTKARLELELQYTINGTTWNSLSPGFDVTLVAAQASDGQQVAFCIVCEGTQGGAGASSAALWTGLRLGATTNNFTPFTGASINVGRIQSSIQQVNK